MHISDNKYVKNYWLLNNIVDCSNNIVDCSSANKEKLNNKYKKYKEDNNNVQENINTNRRITTRSNNEYNTRNKHRHNTSRYKVRDDRMYNKKKSNKHNKLQEDIDTYHYKRSLFILSKESGVSKSTKPKGIIMLDPFSKTELTYKEKLK